MKISKLAILAGTGLCAIASPLMAATPVLAQAPVSSAGYDRAPWWMRASVITQTGYVFTEIPANRASFTATFLSVDDSVDKAQAKAIDQTRALNQSLSKLGKDAVRVTTGFSMRALYEQYKDKDGNRVENQRGDKINGYQVSLTLTVEIRDMAALEKAYALVLAASPTQAGNIDFSLQPSNDTNTWLYNEAIRDAHTRASHGAEAAGARLGEVKVIDPTGRACQTDILAQGAGNLYDGEPQMDYAAPPPPVVQPRMMAAEEVAPPPPMPVPPVPGTAAYLEAKALKNPFIQTPPLQRLTSTACVVYGIN